MLYGFATSNVDGSSSFGICEADSIAEVTMLVMQQTGQVPFDIVEASQMIDDQYKGFAFLTNI